MLVNLISDSGRSNSRFWSIQFQTDVGRVADNEMCIQVFECFMCWFCFWICFAVDEVCVAALSVTFF